MIDAGAGFLAFVGGSMVVLSDGRRGLAVGVALSTLGLGALVLQHVGLVEAGVLTLGGAVAAARRWVAGAPGWGLLPAGSTPRFVLCVAVGLIALWFALLVTSGGSPAFRFAAVAVVGLSGARVLSSGEPAVVLTAVAVLALAVAAASGLGDAAPGLVLYVIAALLAAGACWVRPRQADAV